MHILNGLGDIYGQFCCTDFLRLSVLYYQEILITVDIKLNLSPSEEKWQVFYTRYIYRKKGVMAENE